MRRSKLKEIKKKKPRKRNGKEKIKNLKSHDWPALLKLRRAELTLPHTPKMYAVSSTFFLIL